MDATRIAFQVWRLSPELSSPVTDRDLRLAMPPIWADEHDELMQALHTRRVGDLMITEIVTVQPDTPVEDAAKLLYTHHIGCLPVLEDDRLVCILWPFSRFRWQC